MFQLARDDGGSQTTGHHGRLILAGIVHDDDVCWATVAALQRSNRLIEPLQRLADEMLFVQGRNDYRKGLHITAVCAAQRPKLSDPAREGVRLQPERDVRVRCSACSRECREHGRPLLGQTLRHILRLAIDLLPRSLHSFVMLGHVISISLPSSARPNDRADDCAERK